MSTLYIEKKVLIYFKENSNKGLSMEAQIEQWIEQASKSVTAKSKEAYPTCEINHQRLKYTKGRKYYKVIIESVSGHNGSVYCFIDKEGNIYKASTFKAPAKGIRGNIKDYPANEVETSTGWLYRYR